MNMTTSHSNWYLDAYNFVNQFVTPIENSQIYTDTSMIPVITFNQELLSYSGDFLLVFPYYVLVSVLLFGLLDWILDNSNSNLFLTSLFSFSEKEVNALDDLLISVLLIFCFFFYNFLGCFSFILPGSYSTGFVYFFVILGGILLSIPTTMLYNFGFYFIINIRGGATTLSYLYELVLDYVNLVSFALRLCIQLVRIIVIGVVYYMYNHLFFVYQYLVTPVSSTALQTTFTLSSSLITWARLVFEVGHTFIIFGIQLIAFNVMILWLFQFLFTLFFNEQLEVSFRNLR